MKQLSIIICVYNTQYDIFEKCIQSVYNSTLTDFEVIVVDDGSDIDYKNLAQKYNFRYAKTDNRGILFARLYGIALSEGEYVAFLDSDDTVSFNYYKSMVTMAKERNADILLNDWAFNTQNLKFSCLKDETVSGDIDISGDEILYTMVRNEGRMHSYYVLWNKIYKRSLLLSAKDAVEKLDRLTSLCYSEDVLINFFACKNASHLVNIHTGYYFYRIGEGQAVEVTDKKRLVSQIKSMAYTLNCMKNNIGDNKYREEISEKIDKWSELMSRTHYSYAKSKNYPELYPVIKYEYKVKKLKRSTYKDGKSYVKNEILADNFEQIDNSLKQLYLLDEPVDVDYDKKDRYVCDTVDYLCNYENKIIAYAPTASIKIPRRIIKMKYKFLHNPFIYSLGMIFFRKGSKIRAKLKKKL